MSNPTLEAALDLTKRGMAVLPLQEKRPDGRICPNGFNNASKSAEKLHEWFDVPQPPNIGIATGSTSGLFVVDVDTYKGGDVASLGDLPPTWQVKTGNGGFHFYFKLPEGVQLGCSANRLGASIDTRGDGGYVVAPPSVHPNGTQYTWINSPTDCEPAVLPEHLLEQLKDTCYQANSDSDKAPAQLRASPLSPTEFEDLPLTPDQKRLIQDGAPKGERSEALWSVLRAMVKRGLEDDVIQAVLMDPRYGLSEKPREKKLSWLQQEIARAREKPDDDDFVANSSENTSKDTVGSVVTKRRLRSIPFDEIEPELSTGGIVEGELYPGELSAVFGPPACKKTFYVLNQDLHIALGWDWLGKQTEPGTVVYVAAEGGNSVKKRIKAFKLHYAKELKDAKVPFSLVASRVDLRSPNEDIGPLIEEIKAASEAHGRPLVKITIDTLNRAFGGGDENSPKDMGAFIANCDRIREETGAHVQVVHHTGKEQAKGLRGHTSLLGALDIEIRIERGNNGTSIATVTKSKDGDDGAKTLFALEPVVIGTDPTGNEVEACVVVKADGATDLSLVSTRSDLTEKQQKALKAMCEHQHSGGGWLSLRKWQELMKEEEVIKLKKDGKYRNGDFSELRDQLKNKGEIEVREDGAIRLCERLQDAA